MNYRKLIPMCTAGKNARWCDYYDSTLWEGRVTCANRGRNGECEKEVPERDR